MAESRRRDYVVINANSELADHIDRYLKQRILDGKPALPKIPAYVENALAVVEEKLREESAQLVRTWD
jgi:hypothetical protein